LLCGIPDSCKNLIIAINIATDVENLKLDEIVGQLLQEETRRRTYKTNIDLEYFVARGHFEESNNERSSYHYIWVKNDLQD
jgi:hypothetical protein